MKDQAVVQYAQLSALAKPSSENRGDLQDWLYRPGYGDNFLAGRMEDVWDVEKGFSDYVRIDQPTGQEDVFTRKLSRLILYIYRAWTQRKRPARSIYDLAGPKLQAYADGISNMLGSLLPTASILILYIVHNMTVRLILVLVFTPIFAALLAIISNGRRVEVFAATTA
jgi:hypothetical protein